MALTPPTRSRLDVAMADPTSSSEVAHILEAVTSLAATTLTVTSGELNAWHSSGITAAAAAALVTNQPNYNYSVAGGTSVDVSTVNASTTIVTCVIPTTITQAAGQTVQATAAGIFAATNTGKNLNVYFGSTGTVAGDTAIFSSLAKTNAYSGGNWFEEVVVVFEGTTGAKCSVAAAYTAVTATVTTPQSEMAYTRVTGVTSGVTQYITFALSGTTTDVTLKFAKATYSP